MAKLKQFNKFLNEIQIISILGKEERKVYHESLRLLLENSTTEIIILKPEQVDQIFKRTNDVLTKFRIFWEEYNDLSKCSFENEISVFRFAQLLSYSFEMNDLIGTIDKNKAEEIISIVNWNAGLMAELKNRIIDHFPNVMQIQTTPPIWMKKFPLLRGIWVREQAKFIHEVTENKPESKAKPELKINEIALKYFYEGKAITKENSKEIAQKFGYNSGQNLYQTFNNYSKNSDRKGEPYPYTRKKMTNKIELFENVISILPEEFKQKAISELELLKTIKGNND